MTIFEGVIRVALRLVAELVAPGQPLAGLDQLPGDRTHAEFSFRGHPDRFAWIIQKVRALRGKVVTSPADQARGQITLTSSTSDSAAGQTEPDSAPQSIGDDQGTGGDETPGVAVPAADPTKKLSILNLKKKKD